MNSDSFTLLADQQKTEAVLKATFLAERFANEHYIRLYNIDNFYVEVFFEGPLITKFRAFEHTMFIQPYLEHITIKVEKLLKSKAL
jgi:hypothetical protein